MFGQNDTTIDGLVDWVEVRLVGEILLDLKGIVVVIGVFMIRLMPTCQRDSSTPVFLSFIVTCNNIYKRIPCRKKYVL